MRYFLTTTPNQRNFISCLVGQQTQGSLIKCDRFLVQDYVALAENLPRACDEIWLPYYGSVDGIYTLMALRKKNPDARIVKFYESLISYFVFPWFREIYMQKGFPHIYQDEDLIDEFVGVREMDLLFKRPSHALAPTMKELYKEMPVIHAFNNACGIFIGQPLVEDGSLSMEIYKNILMYLIDNQFIDTYIQHPREKISSYSSKLNIVKLDAPLECYRQSLKLKKLYTIFSTASFFYTQTSNNVTVMDIPLEHFTISPWAQKVYEWLRLHNQTITI